MQMLWHFSRPTGDSLDDSSKLGGIWNQVKKLRYDVFAQELQQYPENDQGLLDDPGEHFIVILEGNELVGYISLNSPTIEEYRLTKYFGNEILSLITAEYGAEQNLYEVRGLTVTPSHRGRGTARQLMLGALKYTLQNGADGIIAMGHDRVLPMYESIGMRVFHNHSTTAGNIVFYPMTASVAKLCQSVGEELNQVDLTEQHAQDESCYHGGASWDESGFDFIRRNQLIVADVLDSPFPPCPEVMDVISRNLISSCQESPPTLCDPLIDKIAQVRQLAKQSILVSSGSSSLMFSLMPRLLTEQSRVLVLSPMYGEYLHILTHIIGCHITHFSLYPEDGFAIQVDDFIDLARRHDAVIIVNPNSPTGVYNDKLSSAIDRILSNKFSKTQCKMIWVDETYIEYVEGAESLEGLTSVYDELIVCKSMSKCYALSGLRVAYAVTTKAPQLRRYIPPWAVSLPAQIGAVAALSNPEYYHEQYLTVHSNRELLNQELIELGFTTYPSVANYILAQLPPAVTDSSQQFIALCREQDVFIRDAENMGITLDSSYVRFAVRSTEENVRIIDCLTKLLTAY